MIFETMKAGKDSVLVKLKTPTINKRGHIHMDTSINKDQHYIRSAEVITTPIGMSRNKYLMIVKSAPLEPYGPQRDEDFGEMTDEEEFQLMGARKTLYSEEREILYSYADIETEVEIGDQLYFNWTSLANEKNFVRKEGEYQIWKIDYQSIFCVVRNKEIIMIGSYVFVEPDWETFEEILIPVAYPLDITGGKKVLRPKNEWLQTKVEPEARELTGFIKHVGSPLKGDECFVSPGDHVMFMKGSKLNVEVEGKKYYAIRQHRFMAVLEEV